MSFVLWMTRASRRHLLYYCRTDVEHDRVAEATIAGNYPILLLRPFKLSPTDQPSEFPAPAKREESTSGKFFRELLLIKGSASIYDPSTTSSTLEYQIHILYIWALDEGYRVRGIGSKGWIKPSDNHPHRLGVLRSLSCSRGSKPPPPYYNPSWRSILTYISFCTPNTWRTSSALRHRHRHQHQRTPPLVGRPGGAAPGGPPWLILAYYDRSRPFLSSLVIVVVVRNRAISRGWEGSIYGPVPSPGSSTSILFFF